MIFKTIDQINFLNYNELEEYYWKLYFNISEKLIYKRTEEEKNQFNYVYKRLKK